MFGWGSSRLARISSTSRRRSEGESLRAWILSVLVASVMASSTIRPHLRRAADLHLTPNGKFLYASERTTSTLAAFRVDAASGKLGYLSSTPTERQPRGFAIDPAGKFLVASGEKSETISVYAIDPASGALRLLQKVPAGKGANWV